MKKIKVGFLSVVAILAMSFTISNQKGVFKSVKKALVDPFCYTNIKTISTCDDETESQVNSCSWSEVRVSTVSSGSTHTDCDANGSTFCCVALTLDTQGCDEPTLQIQNDAQSYLDINGSTITGSGQIKIDQILCKLP